MIYIKSPDAGIRQQVFKVSVIVPAHNEEGNIELLSNKVIACLTKYPDYELLFVDDGSQDGTLDGIRSIRKQNPKVHYISLSRNFGHQNALRAGLDYATGDCVISMDADLQHPPELIPRMIERWLEGYDIVNTIRQDDLKTPFFKRKTANIFYNLINMLSDLKINKGAADYRLLDADVVKVIKTIKENDLFMRGLVAWLGFKQCGIKYLPDKRNWGKTKYTFRKMIRFAVAGITSFSVKPLQISTMLGYIMAFLAFAYGIYAIIIKFFTTDTVSGWTSLLAGILFIGGVQMIMMGILGTYIGKLFIESKKRPNYIIREKSYE